jgi:deoxyhypusine synthase
MKSLKKVKSIELKKNKSIVDILKDMMNTGFQGKGLASAYSIMKK